MTPEPISERTHLQEEIDAASCRQLLAAVQFGRLAIVESGRPTLVVLNHAVDGDDVLFRTGEDARVARLTQEARELPAAFEVDSAFPPGRSGWSVIAEGTLVRESHPARWSRARSVIGTWAEGERDVVLRLQVERLTGRRVGPAALPGPED